jgi:hypothetical protein
MRWASWLLALVGIVQYAAIVAAGGEDYVSRDMSYLVMWLTLIAAVALYACSWCCGWGGGCGCCDDGCSCGDCGECMPNGEHHHAHGEAGHEGHGH